MSKTMESCPKCGYLTRVYDSPSKSGRGGNDSKCGDVSSVSAVGTAKGGTYATGSGTASAGGSVSSYDLGYVDGSFAVNQILTDRIKALEKELANEREASLAACLRNDIREMKEENAELRRRLEGCP